MNRFYLAIDGFDAIAGPVNVSLAHYHEEFFEEDLVREMIKTTEYNYAKIGPAIDRHRNKFTECTARVDCYRLNNAASVTDAIQLSIDRVFLELCLKLRVKPNDCQVVVRRLRAPTPIDCPNVSREYELTVEAFIPQWSARQRMIAEMNYHHEQHPEYGWNKNHGAVSIPHMLAVLEHGPVKAIHRVGCIMNAPRWVYSLASKGYKEVYPYLDYFEAPPKWWREQFPDVIFINQLKKTERASLPEVRRLLKNAAGRKILEGNRMNNTNKRRKYQDPKKNGRATGKPKL